MNEKSNIFINKKILIYGLGKSGISSFNFLKKKNKVFLFDDHRKLKLSKLQKKRKISSLNEIKKKEFDLIIISPGIDINKCKLQSFLKKKKDKIYTDLDVFYSFYKNTCITITGTNGKSTTCKLLYEILKKQKFDVKLAGNIGYPILSVKNIKPKSIFVIEASSYQLDYSKFFKSKIAAILNIKPDHLERHKTLKKYINAKFKLIKEQLPDSIAFINRNDFYSINKLKKNNYKHRIIKVDSKRKKFFYDIKSKYFSSASNKENLSFVLEILKRFDIKKNTVFKIIKNFKGLKYRQQIIYENKYLSIINDSKSTSYSSTIEMLKRFQNIYWLIGGIPKKGDKFELQQKYFRNIRAYIFGKNYKKFYKDLKNKIKLKKFPSLKKAIDEIFRDFKDIDKKKKILLFSPSAASFDTFKNFEDRGMHFNNIIQKTLNGK